MNKKTLILVSGLVGLVIMIAGCKTPVFEDGVTTEKKPWTNREFCNNPDDFQFAILADRTGGERKGVFPDAVRKINLLRPEFVMSVGDLVEGYKTDRVALEAEKTEFNDIIKQLDMPFFFVPGNHDITNKEMAEFWQKEFGQSYYYFIYRNVLFICLDTLEDINGGSKETLSPKQIAWAKTVLKDHPDVRWTFMFMHKPFWVFEEESLGTDGKLYPARATGFKEIEQALQGRDYTVFAGHFHQYTKYERNGKKYFNLATTGGGSGLRGPKFGEFDHAAWVTMTKDGPVIANLMIDGIYDENVTTEAMIEKVAVNSRFAGSLQFVLDENGATKEKFQFSLPIQNSLKQKLQYEISWNNPGSFWQIEPEKSTGSVEPGKEVKINFTATKTGEKGEQVCKTNFHADNEIIAEKDLAFNKILRQADRPVATAVLTAKPPVLDGNIEDGFWNQAIKTGDFRTKDDKDISAPTSAFFTYDKDNLYICIKCEEPNMAGMQTKVTDKDGPVWQDDSVEVFIDTDLDRKTYYQIIVNSSGIIYDAFGYDKSVNLNPTVATAKDKDSWTVEIAIPWENLKTTKPELGHKMGIGLVRSRTQIKEVQQCPVLFGSNHQPDMFGDLLFKK